MPIHPTAIIGKGAEVHESATIGAYSVIGAEVKIAENVRIESHVAIAGKTTIGSGTHVFPFASLGHQPQDLKYKGEPSTLVIGKNNVIREHVTMNPGTSGGGMETIVGDNCLFMTASHLAHDCKVGNHVILANNATLAGHVTVGDYAVIGGLAAIHQFVRIGAHAMIGGMSGIDGDVIPYGSAMGERAALAGLNLLGLKRRGFSKDAMNAIRKAFKQIFVETDGAEFAKRLEKAADEFKNVPEVMEIVEFIRVDSDRQLCKPKGVRSEE